MKRVALLLFAAGLLALTGAMPASAQLYPGGAPFRPGTVCVVTVDGITIGTDKVTSEGVCPVALTCPPNLAGTTVDFRITGTAPEGGSRVLTVAVACPAAPGGPGVPPGGVAITGTNVSVGMVLLGGLLVVGLVALVASRRKKVGAE